MAAVELPIHAKKEELLAAIRDHQVVIVAGETGSGKSTQLPKFCLELGRGTGGRIVGHTQPRRLAARTIAERVAEELDTTVGGIVGYQVRFTDRVGDRTRLKLMTDGILLAEIQRDRTLRKYDTIIVDEAHERSLNIDFILGYLKQLLPRRPDLKVIVTSATIDTERFSRHFDDAPVVEVSGRTYPVDVRYRPLGAEGEDVDQTQAICDAVEELAKEGQGDVLVFLSGEREIRDTADAIKAMKLPHTETLPLYARLSAADQHRVFQPHAGRRVVLATNVAETSLTVPGIRYVVDPGTARISRYSRRTKVQRLPIEPVSQASANQRAGRCGRVAPGICIRLYSEEDFAARPEFTEPEILRTNLASVILQMAAIGLGDVASFPFVDPPDARNIKDGVALLEELGALDPSREDDRKRLTPVGRKLAQLPLDPRLGRMVLEAERQGCVREIMVIAAALSIQDPRERPTDQQQAAAQQHARFADKDSDFLSYLKLWEYLREQQKQLSSNQFRKLCRAEFVNYLRVREWQDIFSQLRQTAKSLGLHLQQHGDGGDGDVRAIANPVHLSLLAGLLSHIGMQVADRQEYLGARNVRFSISPGSALFKKSPRWVMAAELVETNRTWARVVTRIQPEWAEKAGAHLVKRSYTEPHWDAVRGTAMTYERVTLYGLPLVAARKVMYGKVDAAGAREMFIWNALVEGEWETHHAFFHDNRKLLDEVRALEDRARRRDILVGNDALYDFYDRRLPATITSAGHFDRWWRDERGRRPDLLAFSVDMLVDPVAARAGIASDDYPDVWRQGSVALSLSYEFEPGSETDGVTVHVPLAVLNQVESAGFDWQVPGLREELVTALIRSLPKQVRRNFVPVPDYARAFLQRVEAGDGPLLDVLAIELGRMTGDPVPPGSWQLDKVPDHLRMAFAVEDEHGAVVAHGRDLDALKAQLGRHVRETIAEVAAEVVAPSRTWTFGSLPRVAEAERGGHRVKAYPALVDEGADAGVSVRMLPTPAEQALAMWAGTRRLLLLNIPSPARALDRLLTNETKLAVAASGAYASTAAFVEDCVVGAVDAVLAAAGGPAWDEAGFAALLARVRDDVVDVAMDVAQVAAKVVVLAAGVRRRLDAATGAAVQPAVADMRSRLARLAGPGFVAATGAVRLREVPRYLEAMNRRLDKVAADPRRDADHMRRVQVLEREYEELRLQMPAHHPASADLDNVRWMLEELRVSFFAQVLGTAQPVSEARISKAMDRIAGGH